MGTNKIKRKVPEGLLKYQSQQRLYKDYNDEYFVTFKTLRKKYRKIIDKYYGKHKYDRRTKLGKELWEKEFKGKQQLVGPRGEVVSEPKLVKFEDIGRLKVKGLTSLRIAQKQFGVIEEDAAKRVVEYFLEKGMVVELDRAKYRLFTKAEWDILKLAYDSKYAEMEGYKSHRQYFFGS